MEILILVFVLWIGAKIGWWAREYSAIQDMQKLEMEKLEKHLEEKKIVITLEEVQGQIFCYKAEDGSFLAQGEDFDSLTDRLVERFPGKKFICDEKNLREVGFYS